MAPAVGRRPATAPMRLYRARADGEAALRPRDDRQGDDAGIVLRSRPRPEHQGRGLTSQAPGRGAERGAGARDEDVVAPGLGLGSPIYERSDTDGASASTHGAAPAATVGCPRGAGVFRRQSSTRRSPRSRTPSGSARRRRWSRQAAPQPARVLAQALEDGGWFAESHGRKPRQAPRRCGRGRAPDRRAGRFSPKRRGGNAGWRRGRLGTRRSELESQDKENAHERSSSTDILLRAHGRRCDGGRRSLPQAEQPRGGPYRRRGRGHARAPYSRPRRPHRRRGRSLPAHGRAGRGDRRDRRTGWAKTASRKPSTRTSAGRSNSTGAA